MKAFEPCELEQVPTPTKAPVRKVQVSQDHELGLAARFAFVTTLTLICLIIVVLVVIVTATL